MKRSTNEWTQQLEFENYILKNYGRSLEFMLGSWDKRFLEIVLLSINEERFVVLFNEAENPETSIPINSVVGALVLKELLNLTDDEFLSFLINDPRFQYALHLTNIKKQSFNKHTLRQFRKKVYSFSIETGRDLLFEEMETIETALVDFFNIQPDMYRGKSICVAINCRKMMQIEELYNCMAVLVKKIYSIDETFVFNNFSHYLSKEDYNHKINHLNSNNIGRNLQQICNEANTLIRQIGEKRAEVPEFHQFYYVLTDLLDRINTENADYEISVNNDQIKTILVHNTTFARETKKKISDYESNNLITSKNRDLNITDVERDEICNTVKRLDGTNTTRYEKFEKDYFFCDDANESKITDKKRKAKIGGSASKPVTVNTKEKNTQSTLNNNSKIQERIHTFLKKRKRIQKLFWLLIGIVFLFEAAYGIYLGCIKGVLLNDAFSRTANAFYVVFVDPPRYASIGLVWNPLPSTLQIPFMYLAKFWRPIASKGISGAINTAFFAALSAGVILKAFNKFKVSNSYALLVTLLYVLNPFVFFYGANGMSETLSYFFIIYSICSITQWMKFGMSKYMLHLGFAMGGLFLTRYEAIPFVVAVAICVILNILFNPNEKQFILEGNKIERYYYIEGTLILVFLPIVYIIVLWILFNFLISGNPLYFLNSVYSNVSQSSFATINGTYLESMIYVLKRSLPFLPLFITIMAIRLKQMKIMKYDFIALAIFIIIMLSFHYFMLLKGNSYGWLRFFSYSLPICIAWLPYEISEWKSKDSRVAKIIIVSCLIVTSFLCLNALNDKDLAKEELYAQLTNESYIIADYINTEIPDKIILMDVFTLSGVMLNVNNVGNLVVSSSPDFYNSVKDPLHNGINYILIPDPSGAGSLDAINIFYKNLYEDGSEWCVEEMKFDGFKLFRVIN